MASWTPYTGANELVDTSDSGSPSYGTTEPTQSITGSSWELFESSTSTTVVRSGLTAADVMVGVSLSGSPSYSTKEPVQSVGGVTQSNHFGWGSRVSNGKYLSHSAGVEQIGNPIGTIDESPSRIGIEAEVTLAPTGFASEEESESLNYAKKGALLPTRYLRKVKGKVVDKDGERILNGKYIVSLDNFGIVGTVFNDGSFELYLLRMDYKEFMLVVEEDKGDNVDIVHYQGADGNNITSGDENVELAFDTTNTIASGGGGLELTDGISLG